MLARQKREASERYPYHPPLDRVRLRTFWGMRTRKVVTEPVPDRFAHSPQYREGTWSRVKV